MKYIKNVKDCGFGHQDLSFFVDGQFIINDDMNGVGCTAKAFNDENFGKICRNSYFYCIIFL